MKLTEALQLTLRDRWSGQRDADTSHRRASRCLRWLGTKRPTLARLRAMVSSMRAAGLGPATCNRHLSALSAVLEQAGVDLDLPWQKEPRGRTRVLTRDEVILLRGACLGLKHGDAVAALIGFLADTGLRVGEALTLTWDNVRPDSITVQDSKNGDSRWVPLTPEAARILEQRALEFIGPFRLSQSTVNHLFRQARDRVTSLRGDTEIVPHALRHSCASRLVDLQVSLPIVKDFLGHRDIRSTMRYIHPGKDGLVEAARRLGQ